MKDVSGFLSEQQRQSSPEIAAEWVEMEEMYTKR